ncbi:hypothetical protein H5410_021716 [Solanum commersonii]|uniref:Uncharacterized protein n=1 Tax=Solanum commersonii TaxID=4109 RepID=A0A9J5ZBT2_SOLCO|nr:hypothetical protein H5410_021716 [Solanum commersonii]
METRFLGCDRNTVSKQVKSEESTRPKSKILELKPFESSTTKLQLVLIVFKKCAAKDHLAKLVGIVDQLSDPPFGLVHRRLALAFCIIVFWIIGRHSTVSWNCSAIRRLLLFTADLIRSFRAQHTGTKDEDKTFCVHAFLQTPNT